MEHVPLALTYQLPYSGTGTYTPELGTFDTRNKAPDWGKAFIVLLFANIWTVVCGPAEI